MPCDKYSSFSPSLWINTRTNQYFVSYEHREVIKPSVDTSFMLLAKPEPTKLSDYKEVLDGAEHVSSQDVNNGKVKYGNSYYLIAK